MRQLFRRLGFGRLLYLLYFKPLGLLQTSVREGGPINQLITRRGRNAMKRAALKFTPVEEQAAGVPTYEVHLLTGRTFWYQTAFCVRSLIAHLPDTHIRPVFYDDGTLGPHREALTRVFPDALFVSSAEIEERIDGLLPAQQFPALRERREHYPHIRKLIDPHIGATGWKLVLDSDMLFFRRPDIVLEWLHEPNCPFHMVDVEESYGYPRELLSELADAPVGAHLNVGMCGLRSESIDWERLEHWTQALQARFGTHYYLEQALVALILAGRDCTVAPREDYLTCPAPTEVAAPKAVMHHYVALSKIEYFRRGWEICLERLHHVSNGVARERSGIAENDPAKLHALD